LDVTGGDGLYTGVILPSEIKSGGRHSIKLEVTGKSGETKILIPKSRRNRRETQSNTGTHSFPILVFNAEI
jgi:hypothetical protein